MSQEPQYEMTAYEVRAINIVLEIDYYRYITYHKVFKIIITEYQCRADEI